MRRVNLKDKTQKEVGYTLISVLVTLALVAILIASVIPLATKASQDFKLRTLARELEGQLLNTRITAINRNNSAALVFSSAGDWYFLDIDGSGGVNGSEASMWIPSSGFTLNCSAPSTQLPSSLVGGSSSPAAITNRGIAFTPRGSPVQVSSGQVPTSSKLSAPNVIYISDPRGRYAAVSITPAGKVKSWMLSGSTWR
jgi:type II secretory pathway pseudopilin PulG